MYTRLITSALLEEAFRAGTPLEKGTLSGNKLRPKLANDIARQRDDRDRFRSGAYKIIGANNQRNSKAEQREANAADNHARLISQLGKNVDKFSGPNTAVTQQPRLYSSKPNHK